MFAEMATEKVMHDGPKNPTYIEMIVAAIRADASRTGTSKQVPVFHIYTTVKYYQSLSLFTLFSDF
jgi:hypothetical protein